MKCAEARKSLKEYAEDRIENENLSREIEEHITSCALCKRELYLWQEVLSKRKSIDTAALSRSLSEKAKKRGKQMSADMYVPHSAKAMLSLNRFMTGRVGCLLVQLFIMAAGFTIMTLFYLKRFSIGFTALFIFAALVLIYIMIKGKGAK